MIRALVVTPVYPVPDNPQAGVFIHRQVARLVEQGVACHVLTFRPAPPAFPRWLVRRSWLWYFWQAQQWPQVRDGVESNVVFYERSWHEGEDVVPAIGRALVGHIEARPELCETDIVYAHWYWTGGAAALALREQFGWPVAAIARGSEMHDWQVTNQHCRRYVERVIREADLVLANCEDLRDRSESQVPGAAASIEVVYNGCDAKEFCPAGDRDAVRESLGFDPKLKYVLFCGDITSRKGAYELADAWERFRPSHPEWRLVVVGHATEPDAVARLRAAGGDRIDFVGRVPHSCVTRYMQAADAFVQPSRLEGLANATMEAMAVGLPVITTDTCGQRELVIDGENGWLIPSENVAALETALRELATDADRASQYGAAARRTIETRFNPETQAGRLASLLETTVAASRAPAPMR